VGKLSPADVLLRDFHWATDALAQPVSIHARSRGRLGLLEFHTGPAKGSATLPCYIHMRLRSTDTRPQKSSSKPLMNMCENKQTWGSEHCYVLSTALAHSWHPNGLQIQAMDRIHMRVAQTPSGTNIISSLRKWEEKYSCDQNHFPRLCEKSFPQDICFQFKVQ
jgi:hypothetical protein